MKRALWPVSVVAGAVAVLLTLAGGPAWAQVKAGEFTFTWSQVALLVALGAAWGDMRGKVSSIEKRLDRMEGGKK